MKKSRKIETIDDLKLFWEAFSEVYGGGIYIKSYMHPCGWDYVDLADYEDIDDLTLIPLTDANFSYGNYDNHFYSGFTVYDMLEDLGENWCFERNQIDWE